MRTTLRFVCLLLLALSACRDFDLRLEQVCANAPWCVDGGEVDAGFDGGEGGGGGSLSPLPLRDAGCIGLGAWCWESPSPLGMSDLAFVVGTSDTDVYVTGGGGLIAHWDGRTWRQVDFEPALESPVEPTIRVLQPRGEGYLVAGEAMSVWVSGDGGWARLPMSQVDHRFGVAATDAGVYLLRNSSPNVDLVRANGTVATFTRPDLVDSTEAIVFHEGELYFAVHRSVGGSGIQFYDGGFATLQLLGGEITGTPTRFAMLQGKPVMLFTDGRAVQWQDATAWRELPPFETGGWIPEAHAFHEVGGGYEWWVGGQGMEIKYRGERPGMPITYGEGSSFVRAGWMSPSGRFWAVGGNGRVERVGSSDPAYEDLGSLAGPPIKDLAVDGEFGAAAGDQGVFWLRTAAGWTRATTSVDAPVGVDVQGDRFCFVNFEGVVWCSPVSTPSPVEVYAIDLVALDGGATGATTALRGGGMGIAANGRLRASVGGVVAIEDDDGGWLTANPGLGGITTDLVPTDDGAWVATATLRPSGQYVSQGHVTFFDGQTFQACPLPGDAVNGGVYALAAADGGNVLAAGQGWLGLCSSTGAYQPMALSGTENGSVFTSVFLDARGTVWLLTQSGVVYRRAAGASTFTRDRTPLGWSVTSALDAVRITGDASSLWVGVGAGGVLRRPLP